MDFEIKILNPHNTSRLILLEQFRIAGIQTFIKKRYNQKAKIVFDSRFENKNTTYLLFGSLYLSEIDKIKKEEENIFYCSSSFNDFGDILDTFKFIGFCDKVNYMANFPVFYGRKEVSKKMKNVKLGLTKISNNEFYISTNTTQKNKEMIEFIFDYLDLFKNFNLA